VQYKEREHTNVIVKAKDECRGYTASSTASPGKFNRFVFRRSSPPSLSPRSRLFHGQGSDQIYPNPPKSHQLITNHIKSSIFSGSSSSWGVASEEWNQSAIAKVAKLEGEDRGECKRRSNIFVM